VFWNGRWAEMERYGLGFEMYYETRHGPGISHSLFEFCMVSFAVQKVLGATLNSWTESSVLL
jgi:hypothetical protein